MKWKKFWVVITNLSYLWVLLNFHFSLWELNTLNSIFKYGRKVFFKKKTTKLTVRGDVVCHGEREEKLPDTLCPQLTKQRDECSLLLISLRPYQILRLMLLSVRVALQLAECRNPFTDMPREGFSFVVLASAKWLLLLATTSS